MKILLTRDQQNTIRSFFNNVQLPNGGSIYYYPSFMKEIGEGIFETINFEQLPEDAKDMILINHGIFNHNKSENNGEQTKTPKTETT